MTYRSYHDATTRSSVLAAVKDTGDAAAWARFFDLYAGFVFAIARSKGLASEDADDIVQGVFSELARRMPTFEYDRTKGIKLHTASASPDSNIQPVFYNLEQNASAQNCKYGYIYQ